MEKKLLISSVLFALCQTSLQSVNAIENLDRTDTSTVNISATNDLDKAAIPAGAAAINDLTRVAVMAVCYSALTGNNNHSIIIIPLLSRFDNLDSRCHIDINSGWHAGGVVKGRYHTQDCGDILNPFYGGGYTSYVTEAYFEANPSLYPSCNSSNAFICCSPSFPN